MGVNIIDILNLLLAVLGIVLGGKALLNQKIIIKNSKVSQLYESGGDITINNENCNMDEINENIHKALELNNEENAIDFKVENEVFSISKPSINNENKK